MDDISSVDEMSYLRGKVTSNRLALNCQLTEGVGGRHRVRMRYTFLKTSGSKRVSSNVSASRNGQSMKWIVSVLMALNVNECRLKRKSRKNCFYFQEKVLFREDTLARREVDAALNVMETGH